MESDYLTCGQCLKEFPLQRITLFIQHKKLDCEDDTGNQFEDTDLQCYYCPRGFMSAWGLLVHVQITHSLHIFMERTTLALTRKTHSEEILSRKTAPDKEISDAENETSILSKITSDLSNVKQELQSKAPATDTLDQRGGHVRFNVTTDGSAIHRNKIVDLVNEVVAADDNMLSKGSMEIVPVEDLGKSNTLPTTLTSPVISINKERSDTMPSPAKQKSELHCKTVQEIPNTWSVTGSSVSILPPTIESSTLTTIMQENHSTIKLSTNQVTLPSTNSNNASSNPILIQSTGPNLQNVPTRNRDDGAESREDNGAEVRENGSAKSREDGGAGGREDGGAGSREDCGAGGREYCGAKSKEDSGAGGREYCGAKSKEDSGAEVKEDDGAKSREDSGAGGRDNDGAERREDSGAGGREDGGAESREDGGAGTEETESSIDCCDNQGCGITVIPVSHQDLQKCCNAVLPKKRKRHMEMKHMPFSWSSSRYAKRRMLQRSLASSSRSSSASHMVQSTSSGTSTIFIDVEPDSFINDTDRNQNIESLSETGGTAMTVSQSDTNPECNDGKTVPVRLFPAGRECRTKSLILQPGAVFSIPFTYSVPSSAAGTSTSIPISIIKAQSTGKQLDPNSNQLTKSNLIPISAQTLPPDQSSVQLSMIDGEEHRQADIIQDDPDFRRRKYPTSKPFQCDKCPMAFNQRIHLKKHMSKHTGIKPYKCGECDYSTVERSHLKVHIRIHTGEKPFKCTYCEYATAQNSTLKIHLKRHHGGKMFACQSCDKTFTQMEQLKGHSTDHMSISMASLKMKLPGTESNLVIDELEKPSPEKEIQVEALTLKQTEPVVLHDDLGHVLSIQEKE